MNSFLQKGLIALSLAAAPAAEGSALLLLPPPAASFSAAPAAAAAAFAFLVCLPDFFSRPPPSLRWPRPSRAKRPMAITFR